MKLLLLVIILLLIGGYLCAYLLAKNRKRPFLSGNARNRIKRFGVTCFFLGAVLGLFMLYIRIRY
ncbi:hypothetical protein SAMN05660226_02698 [Parapedobacter luteus]|uniref:Uncharacterized protein n=1 Tax=Parapedobacter luteus TaxID=623280 RepID=A0A1T5DCA2_9SPHI|nr:hypothetical protein SAMN05660226_02698 [Parapedobacter luteus]